MNTVRLAFALTAALAAGCSSNPPREIPPETQTASTEQSSAQKDEHFVSLPEPETEASDQDAEQQSEKPAPQAEAAAASPRQSARQQYEALVGLPGAEARALQFYLSTQTFDYIEDGEVFASGPIASGKASSPTPIGNFAVLSKNKDKESSRYTNDLGMQAWMPYSLQFYGNYFVHEGYLPGEPASHGCIRMGHNHAKLLFERMKIGDKVIVSK